MHGFCPSERYAEACFVKQVKCQAGAVQAGGLEARALAP